MTTSRRRESLSKKRIVDAATEILDTDGESGLTFRALASRLATGSGAIYWHVANKDELLAATAGAVVDGVLGAAPDADGAISAAPDADDPRTAIRTLALGLFDAIDAHPWVGTQLTGQPWQPAMLRVYDRVARHVHALGVGGMRQFYCSSAIVNYILGVGGQNAANARRFAGHPGRSEFLSALADRWEALDPEEFPYVRALATSLRDHDDREQFLAGINLIVAGIDAVRMEPDS